MAISVQEKRYSSAHTLRYMANNSAVLYNGDSKFIVAVVGLSLQGKNFSNSGSPFLAINMMTTNKRSPLKGSTPPYDLAGHGKLATRLLQHYCQV
jgi:hypothetical protein